MQPSFTGERRAASKTPVPAVGTSETGWLPRDTRVRGLALRGTDRAVASRLLSFANEVGYTRARLSAGPDATGSEHDQGRGKGAPVIRLRRLLTSGRAHPILGPFLLIMLVIVLALLLLHVMEDGLDAATDVEAFCLAIAMFLGLLLLERVRRHAPAPLSRVASDRGPPRTGGTPPAAQPGFVAIGLLSIPLRR